MSTTHKPYEERLQVVKDVLSGMSMREAASRHGVSRQTASRWVRLFRAQGNAGLVASRPRKKSSVRIHTNAQSGILNDIMDAYPDAHGLPGYLWSEKAVAALIERNTGRNFCGKTVKSYLGRWGLKPQKPAAKAVRAAPQKANKWLRNVWPELRRQANKQGGKVFWINKETIIFGEYSPKNSSARGGHLQQATMLSALNEYSRMEYLGLYSSMNTEQVKHFLHRLRKESSQYPMFLSVGECLTRQKENRRYFKCVSAKFITFVC